MKTFRVIGLMSGTSLDGVDVADVTFIQSLDGQWNFKVNQTKLYDFGEFLFEKLKFAHKLSAPDLIELSSSLGRFYAEIVNQFIKDFNIQKSKIDFISSHGQTVFHQPQKGYTLQIGNGPELSVGTGLMTIVDFRSKDVALGGNGAPLIPVADHLLFKSYADSFLNLGGFSNLSFKLDEKVLSFDVCPVNIVINDLMNRIGQEFDDCGNFGRTGVVHDDLLVNLNQLEYYHTEGPKSLGFEWVQDCIFPLINFEVPLQDLVRTLYEHMAFQIAKMLDKVNANSVLITGGGAKNKFLIERINLHSKCDLIIPEEEIVDFKEAIGFAFLGVLRYLNKDNVYASVTGAEKDSCSGVIIDGR